jgi:hypothetical protein
MVVGWVNCKDMAKNSLGVEDRKATTLSQAVEAWVEAFVDVARLQRWEEWAIGTDRTAEMALAGDSGCRSDATHRGRSPNPQ